MWQYDFITMLKIILFFPACSQISFINILASLNLVTMSKVLSKAGQEQTYQSVPGCMRTHTGDRYTYL